MRRYAWAQATHKWLMDGVPQMAARVQARCSGKKTNTGYLRGCDVALNIWFYEVTSTGKKVQFAPSPRPSLSAPAKQSPPASPSTLDPSSPLPPSFTTNKQSPPASPLHPIRHSHSLRPPGPALSSPIPPSPDPQNLPPAPSHSGPVPSCPFPSFSKPTKPSPPVSPPVDVTENVNVKSIIESLTSLRNDLPPSSDEKFGNVEDIHTDPPTGHEVSNMEDIHTDSPNLKLSPSTSAKPSTDTTDEASVVIPKPIPETSSIEEQAVVPTEQVTQTFRVPRNKRPAGFMRLNKVKQLTISHFLNCPMDM
ncbi:vegetative cell wall protein gp1-like [Dioscorea cayenensis subsp. rotundata]|uniref:Vegetative cell wall protein gp1-like n=1 Tax=Dioscorea cayennensis subsp. rotundata TaxID=55577 RepID=A0AB40CN30_DIOCR|nr:vegetative cell wall protein gp1-like [Dioscorea cayenensis subsp. rotundata]